MKSVYNYGERKRNELINKYASGEILNMGVWGSDQHERLKKKHNRVYSADLSNADFVLDLDKPFSKKSFKNKLFDSIVAAEIIEHLESPTAFVKKCNKILREDGRLVITAPNATSLQHILRPSWGTSSKIFTTKDGKSYKYHISTFTLPMLSSILEMNGFKIVHAGYINCFWSNPIPFLASQIINRVRGDLIVVGEKIKSTS